MTGPEEVEKQGRIAYRSNQEFFKSLKRQKPGSLDEVMRDLHEEEFSKRDCLTCANCCKTTSPAFYERDIERLSKSLHLTPTRFIEKYLNRDDDGDYVLKSAPCPFLDAENYCTVYESRPLACREYPHTNRKRFHQILDITLNNTLICPATFDIIERLKKIPLK